MSEVVVSMDWRQLYVFSTKQALVGFCFEGTERLGREYPEALKANPVGEDLLMTWMGKAVQIRRQNMGVMWENEDTQKNESCFDAHRN